MKAITIICCFLFFGSIAAQAQTKYAVDFIGGMNYPDPGRNVASSSSVAITGGVGVSAFVDPKLEIVGSTVFTRFGPMASSAGLAPALDFIPGLDDKSDNNQYSADMMLGLRLHGQGPELIHPFLALDGGMRILRSAGVAMYEGPILDQVQATTQFLNLHGTEDIYLLGLINFGGGIQLRATNAVWLNVEAKYQILIGKSPFTNTWFPIFVSFQLPV